MSNGRGRPLTVLPRLGMGTGAMSAVACDKLAAAVETFVRGGGTSIDTALTYCGFGGREHYAIQQIARGLKAAGVPRHCMWLTSKIPITSMGYLGTLAAVNATLRAMKVSYLDLLLVHRPNAAPARTKPGQVKGVVTRRLRLGTWRALSEAQAAGQVRFLGVSNYGHPFLRELREACARHGWPLPSYHELEYHPWISAEQRQLVAYSRARGMRIVGYNSLGGSKGAEAAARLPALQAVMGAHNVSIGTALLRYSIDSDVAVIPFASSPEHIAANLAAGRLTRRGQPCPLRHLLFSAQQTWAHSRRHRGLKAGQALRRSTTRLLLRVWSARAPELSSYVCGMSLTRCADSVAQIAYWTCTIGRRARYAPSDSCLRSSWQRQHSWARRFGAARSPL